MSRNKEPSYFQLTIDGVIYGIWKSSPSDWMNYEPTATWWWEIVGPITINTDMKPTAHAKIVGLIDLLRKTSNYAGLTPQQFVAQVLKGM